MESRAEEFCRLIKPHWQALHSVARRYVSGPDDAGDLVQESLLRAWRSYAPESGRSYGPAWLFVIMRSAVADWHRMASHRIKLVPATDADLTELAPADLSDPFDPLPAMSEQRFREFLDDRIAAALDDLEPAFREVVVLSVAGDLNYREIAEVLDCPTGTVMSRMARARRALRERLAVYAAQVGWVREKQR
ncbi:MAG: RNA polymerase sigma factor [Phycisphaerae bacterium]